MLLRNLILIFLFISMPAQAQFPGTIGIGFYQDDPCSAPTPAIGARCSSGTIYAGVFDGGQYMITPGNCTDSINPTCNGGTDSLTKVWGTQNTGAFVLNDEDTTLDSNASTRGQTASAAGVAGGGAAQYCESMNYGGYDDWHLPSKSELAYIYCHANISGGSHNASYPNEDINCASQGGKSDDLPGFISGYYWSSNESSGSLAYRQAFQNGIQGAIGKTTAGHYVRCVRRYY